MARGREGAADRGAACAEIVGKHGAAVAAHDLVDDREAQAAAGLGVDVAGAVEPVEDPVLVLRRDAPAAVADLDRGVVYRDLDRCTGCCT